MSAKKSRRAAAASAASVSAASPPAPVGPAATAPAEPTPPPAWIDSPDPRRRMIAKILLVAVWIYVGALCLLALDQWFHWGIFGPKIPAVP